MNVNFEAIEKAWFKPKKPFDEYIDKQCDYYRQTINTDYKYFKTLFSKNTKEDVLFALTEKCEELQRLHITHFKLAVKEHVENNIISELEEDIKRQITFCTNEAEGTVNNNKCWMAVKYLKHLLNKIQELKKEMK